jgi:hypothetical protein
VSDEILAEIVPDVVLADSLPEETTPPVKVITDVAPISNAAALALRERLALHGFTLEESVPLADVSHQVLAALLEALPAQAGPRPTEEELRGELAERIAQAHRLPRGVRERLASMLTTIRFDDSGRDEPTLRVSDAIALLEETLPAHLLLSADDAQATAHPRGDSFFSGDPRSLSDEDARRIAAEQLARTGYRRA